MPQSTTATAAMVAVPSLFSSLTTCLSSLIFRIPPLAATLSTSTTTTTSTNRWTFFVLGGTVIAVIVIGGSRTATTTTTYPDSRSRKESNSTLGKKRMFGIGTYLVEKISALIPWWSTPGGLSGNRGRIDGVELGERGGEMMRMEEEVGRLRKLVDEAKEKEGEMEELKEEIGRLRKVLDEGRKEMIEVGVGVGFGNEGEEGRESMSENEVIDSLQALNEEIQELAQTIIRAFDTLPRPTSKEKDEDEGEEVKEAVAGVAEILGVKVVELLQGSTSEEREEVVKMALRASMAAYTHWIISSWYFENPEDEHLLSEIYARVRETEEQMVSGRWRALTRVHLQRMLATEPDLMIYVVDAFVNVILTAGWHNDADALQDYIVQTFGHMIGSVLEKAKRLNKAIGEEIVQCDLEALYIAPGVGVNSATMEVVGEGSGVVLCTMSLGLVKAEKRMGRAGEWAEGVLLRPRVVVDSY